MLGADFSSSLRTGKMDDNFLAKRTQCVALATSKENGKRLSDHLYEIVADSKF